MTKNKYIAIAIIVVIIFLLGYCTRLKIENDNQQNADTITVAETVYNNITDTFITYVPKPYKVIEYDTIIILDSASCQNLAKMYFAEIVYNDTIVNDSILFFQLSETVSRNRITNRSINYRANEKIITVTHTINNKPLWHMTADASYYLDKSLILGATVIRGKNGVRVSVTDGGTIGIGYVYKF